MFSLIRIDNFETKTEKKKSPFLLAVIGSGINSKEQIDNLKSLSERCSDDFDIYLAEEDSTEAFRAKFGLEGTPTFLILEQGKEKNRMLGRVTINDLAVFVGDLPYR